MAWYWWIAASLGGYWVGAMLTAVSVIVFGDQTWDFSEESDRKNIMFLMGIWPIFVPIQSSISILEWAVTYRSKRPQRERDRISREARNA